MSSNMWDKIKEKLDNHSYMGEIDRDEYRIKATAEVFTPTDLVIRMLKKSNLSDFSPGKTILDPACGDGQFLVAIKWLKVFAHNMSEEDVLNDIYGVDIMRDNVDLCKKRLGGGTIIMGDSLNPSKKLEQQSDEEYHLMMKIFLDQVSIFV